MYRLRRMGRPRSCKWRKGHGPDVLSSEHGGIGILCLAIEVDKRELRDVRTHSLSCVDIVGQSEREVHV